MTRFFLSFILVSTLFACGKKNTNTIENTTLKTDILHHVAYKVCAASYTEMYHKALSLEQSINTLQTTPTQNNLLACRDAWKQVRETWETTESWLFGPISANNIDPRIDTWPVDFVAIDSVLASPVIFTDSYMQSLDDALKGFHPIEYFMWGANGNKLASDFTPRQFEYLQALSKNLRILCEEVNSTWVNGYADELAKAGNGSTTYSNINSAYIEIVDAMSGICDEVANGKINDPFLAQDPLLEESPFSKNSIVDFTKNIDGVMVIYQGYFNTDGLGVEDLVRQYNTSLDLSIKQAHGEAINALQAVTLPFGEAIISQPVLVQNAIHKINALHVVLDTKLKPFLQQYAK